MFSSPSISRRASAFLQMLSMFRLSYAEISSTGGCHFILRSLLNTDEYMCFDIERLKADSIYLLSLSHGFLNSASYLLMQTMSAISITPFFEPYKLSPLPGGTIKTTQSTTWSIEISDWPTPTVSIRMTSYPTCSQSN